MIPRIVGTAVIGVLLIVTIKRNSPEQGFILSVGAVCILSFLSAAAIAGVIGYLRELADGVGLDAAVFDTLIKVLGISIIIRVTGDLCRDANEQGVASAVEIGGTALIIYTALPMFGSVLNLIKALLP